MNSATFSKLVIIATLLMLLPASQVSAADITTSATCTLENAWASAKAGSNTGGCVAVGAYDGNDTIILHDDAVIAGSDLTLTTNNTITVEGEGFTINANKNDQHFATAAGATINLKNVKLTGGRNGQPSSITVADNGAASAINIENSVICGNESTSNAATASGAIHVSSSQNLFIRNSIICNNTGAAWGGGLKNIGFATVINSVFYGNRASADGGAIHSQSAGLTILRHVTITKNRAPNGSGIYIRTGNLEIRNSIIHGNTDSHDCRIHSNHIGTVTASGVLVGTSTCGNKLTPVSTDDPRLIDRTGGEQVPTFTAHYALGPGSPAIDDVPCLAGVSNDLLGRSRPLGSNCDIGAIEYVPPPPQQPTGNGDGDDGGDSGRGEDRAAMAPTPVRISPAQTCKDLAPGIMVSNQSPGTSCQLVQQPSGYGHRDLAAAMPSSVVDLWGWITPSTKICFQATSGSIRFVDTTVLPRTLSTLPVFSEAGMLCSTIDRAGQVALIADGSPPPTSVPVGQPAERSLSDCMVRAEYSLNFRDAPAGQKIGGVPHNAVLTALARTTDWFKVDYHGAQGWIAARYVAPMGLCG